MFLEGFQNGLCLFDFRFGNRLYKELIGVDYLSLELKKVLKSWNENMVLE
jgi:hypothetical protein